MRAGPQLPHSAAILGLPPKRCGETERPDRFPRDRSAAMDALPPPVPTAFPSPSTTSPPPALPFLVGSSAPPSIPILVGDGQPEARPEMKASKIWFDGGEPHPGTDGVGRVDGQEIDGGDPQPGTDDGADPQLCIDVGGKKRSQCNNNERRKPNKSSIIPTINKVRCHGCQMQNPWGQTMFAVVRKPCHNGHA